MPTQADIDTAVAQLKAEMEHPAFAAALDRMDAIIDGGAPACNHCPEPALRDLPLCEYHADLEAACNIAEDRCYGMTPPGVVRQIMTAEFGWQLDEVLRREGSQTC